MQIQPNSERALIFSASDLVYFLACDHLTSLDLRALEPNSGLTRTVADDSNKLIQEKGFAHEENYLQALKLQGLNIADLSHLKGSLDAKVQATKNAMCSGKDVIYQAALHDGNLIGYADFLRRVDKPSNLGDWSYEVEDTKFARSPKAKFIIQLCFYSDLIAKIQGQLPERMHLILGNNKQLVFHVTDYIHYYRTALSRFLDFISYNANATYPEACKHCDLCHWQDECQQQWLQDDHLNQVANIRKSQIQKLNQAGIKTLAELAQISPTSVITGINPDPLEKLRTQAKLQLHKRTTGENKFELLTLDANQKSGFYRLPKADKGDLFFDMEGDPLEPGGLEYLFGVYFFDNEQAQFKAFWAHDRSEERIAFEAFMDFVTEWLRKFPEAQIYHYNHYEVTALKRLMSVHGSREHAVDNLLRRQKFVDLYKVVREAIQVSEPGYSIKNLEAFYMADDPRSGDVKNASASIVYYENWRNEESESKKTELLESIRSYNEYDCRSTYELRQWLLTIRPELINWFNWQDAQEETQVDADQQPNEWEQKLATYRTKLIDNLPKERNTWTQQQQCEELLFYLLDFHRRADKPAWWKFFDRQEKFWSGNRQELFDDVDCIAELTLSIDPRPEIIKRSCLYTYRYPAQEIKFSQGNSCIRVDTLERLNNIEHIDEDNRLLKLKVGLKKLMPDTLTISKGGPLAANVLKDALLRFADSYIAEKAAYPAIKAFLLKDVPSITGHSACTPVIKAKENITAQAINAAAKLQNSYLFVQGPPGAGKTYTGSHMIVFLLSQGKKIGVTALSHKAIINLLQSVENLALETKINFIGIKKSDDNKKETHINGTLIKDVFDNKNIDIANANLIAGTAYLFARPEFDQQLDYLFVDEAGQVALANLVAMGTSAKNIVLLGDQMQLGQPTQGVHPGDSGKSALEYLLGDEATIAPERGIFLETTWRMHENVCRFISDAVYDGKLHPEPANQNQQLILNDRAHQALKSTGISFIPAEHSGCSQSSLVEAEIVKQLYDSLLEQSYIDKKGLEHRISPEDILVLSPYNMQVNLLKKTLPEGARVGTVDKFQGQEAQAVIISMATSSGEDLPRDIEFLFSKNRLNVSISRAKCQALLVANPALMTVHCNTLEQMELINTLCWLKEYSNCINQTII